MLRCEWILVMALELHEAASLSGPFSPLQKPSHTKARLLENTLGYSELFVLYFV